MQEFARTIATEGTFETEVRKSRFICTLRCVTTEEDARAAIESVRKQHWSANHNCTAWRIGESGRYQRSSDDGEPSGTAGTPILEVLRRRDLTDVVAIVTRYFGGVLLGAGGLIRAYGGAVSAAVDHLGVVERRPLHVMQLRLPHADAGRVENVLRASGYPLLSVDYEPDSVAFTLHLEDAQASAFVDWSAEITNGMADVRDNGVVYVEVPVNA